jgi:Methionine synthase I, cobalamin-binding domain
MIIIGEKINGAIPSVSEAIEKRDEQAIRKLARRQKESGANFLDVCAGTSPEFERDVLSWLIDVVQDEVDAPICLDSPDPYVLRDLIPRIHIPGIVNSVSGEGNKCDVLFPVIANTDWKVIALTCDDSGIPSDVSKKVIIGSSIVEKAASFGIAADRIFIDPLVLSLSAVNNALYGFTEAIRKLRELHPTLKFTSGLSNISYGMPKRRLINQNFLAFAMEAGMDSAIMDPTNDYMYSQLLAVEAILGKDRYCRSYNNAYRKGRLV